MSDCPHKNVIDWYRRAYTTDDGTPLQAVWDRFCRDCGEGQVWYEQNDGKRPPLETAPPLGDRQQHPDVYRYH